MSLELRPNCERCDVDLEPEDPDARICSYECTFCADCVASPLRNVCPNCGGGFVPRPIRPWGEWRPGAGLEYDPASTERVHSKVDVATLTALVKQLADVDPSER